MSTHTADTEGYVDDYIHALKDSGLLHDPPFDYHVMDGKKYLKVIQDRGGSSGSSVHAFIDKATGDVIKAATWRAPQRNSDGTLAVRYSLQDSNEREELCRSLRANPQAFTGGYLYKR